MKDPTQKLLTIVIPVYKHSSLISEAVESIVSQKEFERTHIVIVDDGCPFGQTSFSCCGLAEIFPNVHYIRQKNSGLSAARNKGIEFTLTYLPESEAVYFLDADNRLRQFSLARFFSELAAHPDADWFYPDIEMFGLEWTGDYSGPFSRLTESLMNICEAGSLVRRRVFESGLRFDEKMRSGYEDWEFWISAMASGFVGRHMPGAGFHYRKRAESMLADSTRKHDEILSYIESKHGWLRDPVHLLNFEHKECPRYAIVMADAGSVILATDPHSGRRVSMYEYVELLLSSFIRPNWFGAGSIIVFTSKLVLDCLSEAGMLRFVLWKAECDLNERNFSVFNLGDIRGSIRVDRSEASDNSPFQMVALSVRLLRAMLSDPSDEFLTKTAYSPAKLFEVVNSVYFAEAETASLNCRQHEELYGFLRRVRSMGVPMLWSGLPENKSVGTPDKMEIPFQLRNRFNNGVMPNCIDPRASRIIFALPIFDFGGVERVALNVARELKHSGFTVDLLLTGRRELKVYDDLREVFSDFYLLDNEGLNRYDGPVFNGTHLSKEFIEARHPEIVNLLSSYSVVVNCHSGDVLNVAGKLRKYGVVFVNYLHLLEYTEHGRVVGHPIASLAYEHATDIFACCSDRLALELGALGVPKEKIISIPNGPGIPTPLELVEKSRFERALRRVDNEPLRVLYIGRLDAQKGLEALQETVKICQTLSPPIHFRLVGGRIVRSDSEPDLAIDFEELIEAPVYSSNEIGELYIWADVIIMTSKYEGLPLALVEAMVFGVVPISTDVGAISELIEHGENGFLVDPAKGVEELVAWLQELNLNRDLLARLSTKGQAAATKRSWKKSTEPLLSSILRLTKPKKNMSSRRTNSATVVSSGETESAGHMETTIVG